MRIGSSIGLIAIGLILALAVNIDVDGIDLLGWILAAVCVVGLITSLALARRSRPVVAREEAYPPPRTEDPRY